MTVGYNAHAPQTTAIASVERPYLESLLMLNLSAPSKSNRDATVARSLTWRYAIALALVASLSTAAWLSLHLVISEQRSTAAVVNISGRQRMLSQRTALFSNLLVTATPADRPPIHAKLQQAIELMTRSHYGLTQGDAAMGLPAQMSAAAYKLYFDSVQSLDMQVRTYVSAVLRLLANHGDELTPNNPDLQLITRTASGPLVKALDEMVQLYQQEGEAKVANLEKAETLFWLVTLLLLLLEAALIFHPFARHVNKVIGKLQDTTQELQRRTLALTQSEEKFRLISTAAQDAIVIVGPDDHIVYWNPAAQRMFGYTQEDLQGIQFQTVLVPERLRKLAETSLRYRQARVSDDALGQRFETLALRRNGEEFPIDLSVTVVDLGQVRHGVAMIRDITQQKRLESELRIAATAFNTQMGMIITDAHKIILRVNQAFAQITGYSEQDVIGKTPQTFSSGRHDALFYQTLYQTIARQGVWSGEIWDRHKNGTIFPEWLTITAVKNTDGEITHYVAAFSDISERKATENQIRNLAFYDSLTHLPNRRLLMDRLKLAMTKGSRSKHFSALLFVDLDNFKTINDTLGHHVGDLLLEQVAQRLGKGVRHADTVARLGGDEFVVMLEELGDTMAAAITQADLIGNKLMTLLREPYLIGNKHCHVTASIGIALFSDHRESTDDVLKRADMSMYQAKASGRNTLRFFDPKVQVAVEANAALEMDMRLAIKQQQFCLYYQVQVRGDGTVMGAEALLRWLHPLKGIILPARFIQQAEQSGLILSIGAWVLDSACSQLALWQNQPHLAHLTLAVNISVRQFRQPDFVDQVIQTLRRTGINPSHLKIELTESLWVDDIDDVITKMTTLKAMGVEFSLDDFGTGYSSLAYLSRMPINQIKIDSSFVNEIETSDNAVTICAAAISLAHSLKMTVVAEGVENQAQLYFLSTVHHCDLLQGYLFGYPMPVAEFEVYVLSKCAKGERADDSNSPVSQSTRAMLAQT